MSAEIKAGIRALEAETEGLLEEILVRVEEQGMSVVAHMSDTGAGLMVVAEINR